MRAADQWGQIEAQLGPLWAETQLSFTPEGSLAEAAVVLAPLQPVRVGDELRFHVARADAGGERVRNVLRRLDRKRIWGTLALIDATSRAEPGPSSPGTPPAGPLAAQWDDLLATLPPDWSDVLAELELDSSDNLPRAALHGAPMNPTRVPDALALRFRVSGKQGYGVAPHMARRCFERMDAEGITGRVTVVYDLSDTANDVTQGPVWRVAGRSV
ncbi:MAG TPA: hypothetical protein VFU84_06025 [Gaiellaceae bacterium]|nr:hypothetical protein [Gaiellaceae bacterium]